MDPIHDIERCLHDARKGSSEAVGQLLEACQQYLLLIAGSELPAELHGKLDASDLVQETFLEAHQDFHQFQGNTEAQLLGWLRQILMNNLRDATRRYQQAGKRQLSLEISLSTAYHRRQQRSLVASDSAPSPSWLAVVEENRHLMEKAVAGLPDDYRKVIELRNFELRPFSEIGHIMNRSADAARKLWSRAIERLARQLVHEYPGRFR